MQKTEFHVKPSRLWTWSMACAAMLVFLWPPISKGYNVSYLDANCGWTMMARFPTTAQCTITNMEVYYKSQCDNNGTEPYWGDDFYLANFRIYHDGEKLGDTIEVMHPALLARVFAVVMPIDTAHGYTHVFAAKMQTAINTVRPVPGWVKLGTFTVNIKDATGILCTKDFNFNGKNDNHVRPCSISTADGGAWNRPYPACWPDETATDPCNDPLNHAPDPDHPQLTPERWVKVILHIFQREHPDSLNQYVPHPTDPANYSQEHIGLFKRWFNEPGGVNSFMANLCEPSDSVSPHIADSRIRFLLEFGEEGNDIFFHPDNKRWGIGYYPCGKYECGHRRTYKRSPGVAKAAYVTGGSTGKKFAPFLPQWYIDTITVPGRQQAMHVFFTRGTWKDLNKDGKPDENLFDTCAVDCFNFWPGGYTVPSEVNCNGDRPQFSPTQYIYGNYEAYLFLTDSNYAGKYNPTVGVPDSVVQLGSQITGEFFHVFSVDHPSPFQNHYKHSVGDDGCIDTDGSANSNNLLGTNFENRCALTQCQIGRMHRYFAELQPAIERFPDGKGGWSRTPELCTITASNMVIPKGAAISWGSARQLRSNLIIESGASLTVTCDLGMPENARITVRPGGRLVVQGARVYNNCPGTLWHGIIVEEGENGNSGKVELISANIENALTGVK